MLNYVQKIHQEEGCCVLIVNTGRRGALSENTCLQKTVQSAGLHGTSLVIWKLPAREEQVALLSFMVFGHNDRNGLDGTPIFLISSSILYYASTYITIQNAYFNHKLRVCAKWHFTLRNNLLLYGINQCQIELIFRV